MSVSAENFENFDLSNMSFFNLANSDYEDKCDKFRITKKAFQIQYFPYYNARINQMNQTIEAKAKLEFGDDVKFFQLNELNDETENLQVCLVGVIFKYSEKHPSILKEVSEEYTLNPELDADKFVSENDYLMLQQGKDTIRLNGNIKTDEFVNGVVIAIYGHNEDVSNSFIVENYCCAGPVPCVPRPLVEKDQFIIFVSGLGFSNNMSNKLTDSLNSLTEYLISFNGNCTKESSKIVKLIIAGNCISKNAREEKTEETNEAIINQQWNKKQKINTTEIMKLVDDWIFEVAKFIEVDIMPGEHDPASILMPQQPFHVAILPKCSIMKTVRCLTNPYAVKISGTNIVGCSGQTVNTVRAYTSYEETLDILKQKIIWSHLAPTAPDALYTYPYTDKDPFVIDECPHILFSGNQDHFNTQIYDNDGQEVRLVSVPSFEDKLTCVLVNLKNLKCDFMAFN